MKLRKTASGKTELKLSKTEWEAIGKKAGWLEKKANKIYELLGKFESDIEQAVMDGMEPEHFVAEFKRFFGEGGSPGIQYFVDKAAEKASRHSQQGLFGLVNEGMPGPNNWVSDFDGEFGDPNYGPKSQSLIYMSYAEAEADAKESDYGLDVMPR
jgi:hypothetical protein